MDCGHGFGADEADRARLVGKPCRDDKGTACGTRTCWIQCMRSESGERRVEGYVRPRSFILNVASAFTDTNILGGLADQNRRLETKV